MKVQTITYFIIIGFFAMRCSGQETSTDLANKTKVEIHKYIEKKISLQVGAENTDQYLSLLANKKVGVVANHTSMIKNTHLVDSLLHLNINVKKVFSPEHGFRGTADAGERVNSNIDPKTQLPIISLYGKNKKPFPNQVKDLDVIIFDIQDVGARFYTYISTMHYVMEACAENNIDFIVLDRPNPNGHYVDGPILEKDHQSFVGMHPVPIVHGMTVGEYAKMINGEGWLKNGIRCNLTVIATTNYDHATHYNLPIKPSPNLPSMNAIYLYPSLCLFEGTPISVGRGTDQPFQVLGHPKIKSSDFIFTPKSRPGAKKPKLINEKCYGFDLSQFGEIYLSDQKGINLFWLISIYQDFPEKENFFTEMFTLLSGTKKIQQQIEEGWTEEQIKASWKEDLIAFKQTRKKYLLYGDFE